jgi:hypothetical protein
MRQARESGGPTRAAGPRGRRAREGGGPARAVGPRERRGPRKRQAHERYPRKHPDRGQSLGPRSGRTRVADRGRPGLAHHRPPLTKTARFTAGGFRSRFGPIGTGRGTCQKGPVRVARAAGGADVCGFARTYEGIRNRLHVSLHPAENDAQSWEPPQSYIRPVSPLDSLDAPDAPVGRYLASAFLVNSCFRAKASGRQATPTRKTRATRLDAKWTARSASAPAPVRTTVASARGADGDSRNERREAGGGDQPHVLARDARDHRAPAYPRVGRLNRPRRRCPR